VKWSLSCHPKQRNQLELLAGGMTEPLKFIRKGRAKANDPAALDEFLLRPDPEDPRLTQRLRGFDQEGQAVETAVVMERPLTLFLNGQEIVTMRSPGELQQSVSEAVSARVCDSFLQDPTNFHGAKGLACGHSLKRQCTGTYLEDLMRTGTKIAIAGVATIMLIGGAGLAVADSDWGEDCRYGRHDFGSGRGGKRRPLYRTRCRRLFAQAIQSGPAARAHWRKSES